MKKLKSILVYFVFMIYYAGYAQINCSTLDINKVPGKWVWQKGGFGNQWQECEPIRKEIQRIVPNALEGLHATNSIAFGDEPAIPNTKSAPKLFEYYFMLKKYECLKGYNIVQPEGVTGCWLYFVMNSIFQGGSSFQDALHFGYYENEGGMYVGDFYTQKDAQGNRIVYASTFGMANQKRGYYFSAKDRLPIRKVSWKELIMSYYTFTEKELNGKLTYVKEGLAKNEKELTTTQYEDTKKYLTNLIADRKKEINNLEASISDLKNWNTSILKHNKINETAQVTNIRLDKNVILKLMNETSPATTYPVWVDDINFYDLKLPKDQPQCIYMYARRQDADLPKKNFMDLIFSQFNMDVLAKMVGEESQKNTGVNTMNASLGGVKSETKKNQNAVQSFSYSFEKAVLNKFPEGWNGMKNITVQQYDNKNWLAFTKDGYWYPKQFNKEIRDNFTLSFDLRWNKDIAYNSGLFTVSFSEIPYDNTGEAYKMNGNQNQYWSFYDSYVGNFNRIMIWFDPYANGGGTVEVYSYDQNEKIGVRKRITLPDFYMTMNNHQLKIQRKGNALVIFINNKKEAEIDNVFIPSVKYNLFTFSRYKGNNSDNKNDVFYLNSINANY